MLTGTNTLLMIIVVIKMGMSCRQGKCRLSIPGHPCEVGMRRRTYHVLTGSLLGVWTHLEGVFARHPSQNHRMQIIRIHSEKKKLVGQSYIMS